MSYRRILIVGQTGAGKSILTNALYNDSVTVTSLQGPAEVAASGSRQTVRAKNFTTSNNMTLYDTVGFDDEDNEDFLYDNLCLILYQSRVRGGFTHVLLVVPFARVAHSIKKLLVALKIIFGSHFRDHIILVVTHCDDSELNRSNFLKESNISLNDELDSNTYKGLVSHIYRTGRQNDIVFGSMMNTKNAAKDVMYYEDRVEFLSNLKDVISQRRIALTAKDIDDQYLISTFVSKMNAGTNILSKAGEFIRALMTRRVERPVVHFAPCNLCSRPYSADDMPCAPLCGHICHRNCLSGSGRKVCITCGESVDENYLQVIQPDGSVIAKPLPPVKIYKGTLLIEDVQNVETYDTVDDVECILPNGEQVKESHFIEYNGEDSDDESEEDTSSDTDDVSAISPTENSRVDHFNPNTNTFSGALMYATVKKHPQLDNDSKITPPSLDFEDRSTAYYLPSCSVLSEACLTDNESPKILSNENNKDCRDSLPLPSILSDDSILEEFADDHYEETEVKLNSASDNGASRSLPQQFGFDSLNGLFWE